MANTLHYKKEYCDMLQKHMAQGLSFRSFAAVIKVSRTAMYQWVDKYPEFKEAKEVAEDSALLFFERRLVAKASGQDLSKQGIDTKKIDLGAICFPMKTRFHEIYGDRQKVEHTTNDAEIKITIDSDDSNL